jgi:hypothetical protein
MLAVGAALWLSPRERSRALRILAGWPRYCISTWERAVIVEEERLLWLNREDGDSTNEDRFGRQDAQRYSTRSSALAIVLMLVVLGLAYLLFG